MNARELEEIQKRLYDFIRTTRPACCRAFEIGTPCQCPLCDVDALLVEIRKHLVAESEEEKKP